MLTKKIIILLVFILSIKAQATPLASVSVIPASSRIVAPGFQIENLQGGNTRLADYKGRLVLLNFWATWCIPCREEMPGMEILWQNHKEQGLVIVAVSIDESSRTRVEKFTEIFDLSFPVLLDPESKVSDLYKVSSMPTSFLIDRSGKLIARMVGTEDWSSPEAIQFMQELLSQ